MESSSDDKGECQGRSTSPATDAEQQQHRPNKSPDQQGQQYTSPSPEQHNSRSVHQESHQANGLEQDDERDQGESQGAAYDYKRSENDERAEQEADDLDDNDILQKLENVDLSEEDTEIMLQEAYAMNRQLKEILRQQESAGDRAHVVIRSKLVGSRNSGSRGGKHAVLPPIKGGKISKQNELYGVKLSRPHPSATSSSSSGRHETAFSHSVPRDYRHSSASPPKSKGHRSGLTRFARQNSEDRPVWNDRFSYT